MRNPSSGIGFVPNFCKKCGNLMYPTPQGVECPRCGYKEPLNPDYTGIDRNIKSDSYTSPNDKQNFKPCISSDILDALGLEYLVYQEKPMPIKKSGTKFRDLLTDLCNKNPSQKLCDLEMYDHQKSALEILLRGRSIIVTVSTGGGKTEIWVSYALSKQLKDKDFKVLAIYPTKSLASDQIYRISKYYNDAGFETTS
ncbi:MAG: DEAD/DEAH box helicase [Sulfolobales archaeon]